MQLLYRSIDSLTVGGVTFILRVSTDGATLTVDLEQNPRAVTAASLYDVKVYYGNMMQNVSVGAANSGSAAFPYERAISQITLGGAAVTYGGASLGSTATFAWGTVYSNPLPAADFLPDGPQRVSESAVRCTVYAPEGKYPALLGVWANRRNHLWGWQVQQTLNLGEKNGGNAWHLLSSPYATGDLLTYTYVVAYYGTAEAALYRGSDYEAIAELTSPVYTVSDNGGYYVPYNLAWPSPVRGCPVQVTWGTFLDMKGIFQLQRSVDGGEWELVYAGESNRFTDTAGNWTTAAYRVRSYKGYSDYYSQWVEGAVTEVGQSNLYVGVNGVPKPASGVYLGRNGDVVSVTPMMYAGR